MKLLLQAWTVIKFLDFPLKLSSLQVILSTNIAESSVTVPDVKYGWVLVPTLIIK